MEASVKRIWNASALQAIVVCRFRSGRRRRPLFGAAATGLLHHCIDLIPVLHPGVIRRALWVQSVTVEHETHAFSLNSETAAVRVHELLQLGCLLHLEVHFVVIIALDG